MTSLKFIGDVSPAVGAALALFAAVACWCFYRRETRKLPQPLAWLLPFLRSFAIALSLLVLTGPVLHHRYRQGNPGRISVLVDGSQSMFISDKQAEREQKIEVARALGWVRDTERSLAQDQTSLAPLHQAVERFDQSSRYGRAIELLLSSAGGLLESLRDSFEIRVSSFDARGSQVLWESTLASPSDLPPSIDAWRPASPARSTDIGTALKSAFGTDSSASTQRSAVGPFNDASTVADSVIVLLTDGQHNSGNSPIEIANQLSSEGRKVFIVGYGSMTEADDIGINAIEHPERLFHTDNLRGKLIIKDRFAGKPITATIKHRGKVVWETHFTADNSAERRVDFSFPLEAVVKEVSSQAERGIVYAAIPLEFDVELSHFDGEADLGNNQSQFNVTAVTQQAGMLIVDGRSRWETRYLRNIFQRDPTWSVDSVIEQPGPGTSLVTSASTSDVNASFPDSREQLLEYDLIVLGEVSLGSLGLKQLSWIREFVEVSGGGLIVIDGARGHLRGNSYLPLHPLFPVRWHKIPLMSEFPHRAALTAAGSRLAALQLAESDEAANEALWRRLPELRYVSHVEALPGSEILATAKNDIEQSPLFITRQFGAGRVFFSATDETWRWRYRIADVIHQRLWNQIARWVMRLPMAVHGQCLSLDSGRSSYAVGDSIEIRARLKQLDGQLATSQSVEAIVDCADRTVLTLPLMADPSLPGVYAGRVEKLPIGNYTISVRASGFSRESLDIQTQFSVVEPNSVEMQQLARNKQLLEKIAETTGGKYLDEEEGDQLRELLRPLSGGTIDQSETVLWQSYWWFVPILASLTLEWWLRKKAGLL